MIPALCVSLLLLSAHAPDDAAYVQQIETWRKDQEHDLTKDQGWLSLVGLFWLQEGDNSLGSAPSNKVVLPPHAPASFGKIVLKDGATTLRLGRLTPAQSPTIKLDGAMSVSDSTTDGLVATLSPDSSGSPTKVSVGSTTFMVIKRGSRIGVRIWDKQTKNLTEFKGCKWYPVDPSYRVEAEFFTYPKSKSISITNVLGDTAPVPTPGYVKFTLNGKPYRLEALSGGDGLFFNFHDKTSGLTTYPAGRFLDTAAPKDGKVILDFNQATNPPCAFTTFATCPLPPSANFLDIEIPAGEKAHHPK